MSAVATRFASYRGPVRIEWFQVTPDSTGNDLFVYGDFVQVVSQKILNFLNVAANTSNGAVVPLGMALANHVDFLTAGAQAGRLCPVLMCTDASEFKMNAYANSDVPSTSAEVLATQLLSPTALYPARRLTASTAAGYPQVLNLGITTNGVFQVVELVPSGYNSSGARIYGDTVQEVWVRVPTTKRSAP